MLPPRKSEALDYRKGIAGTMQGFGNVYANLSEYDKALEYYHKALSVNEELSNTPGIASSLGGIGTVYARISDSVQAMEYYHRALLLMKKQAINPALQLILVILGPI